MGFYDSSISLMKRAMDATQNKYDEDNADNYILRCKNAIVIWYQPNTLIACVRFCEDKNNNEYHLYNRCCAFLSPGDQVKVYYTTNAAKGWIAVRCGKPNFLNEYGQNIFDIGDCCEGEGNGGGETCCNTDCCAEAATQHKDTETVVVEEWTERIEGSEDEVREYESGLPNNPPFDAPTDNPSDNPDTPVNPPDDNPDNPVNPPVTPTENEYPKTLDWYFDGISYSPQIYDNGFRVINRLVNAAGIVSHGRFLNSSAFDITGDVNITLSVEIISFVLNSEKMCIAQIYHKNGDSYEVLHEFNQIETGKTTNTYALSSGSYLIRTYINLPPSNDTNYVDTQFEVNVSFS